MDFLGSNRERSSLFVQGDGVGCVSSTELIGNLSHFFLDPRGQQPRSRLLGLLGDRASSLPLLFIWNRVACSGAKGKMMCFSKNPGLEEGQGVWTTSEGTGIPFSWPSPAWPLIPMHCFPERFCSSLGQAVRPGEEV